MTEKQQPRCFVIMPFTGTTPERTTEHWTKHFDNFLKPTIEEVGGILAFRSQSIRQDLIKQIVTDLITADIVVADLTDLNANVFWELGVRQSFRSGTITIYQEGTKTPFDISPKGHLPYPVNKPPAEVRAFETQLKDSLKHCLEQPNVNDSAVLDTIGGRGTIYELVRRDEAIRRVEALIAELQWNMKVAETVYNKTLKNKDIKEPTERRQLTALRPRTGCLELLVSTRYLEEGGTFYFVAEGTLGQIASWAAQVEHTSNNWTYQQAAEFIISQYTDFIKRVNGLLEVVSLFAGKLHNRQ